MLRSRSRRRLFLVVALLSLGALLTGVAPAQAATPSPVTRAAAAPGMSTTGPLVELTTLDVFYDEGFNLCRIQRVSTTLFLVPQNVRAYRPSFDYRTCYTIKPDTGGNDLQIKEARLVGQQQEVLLPASLGRISTLGIGGNIPPSPTFPVDSLLDVNQTITFSFTPTRGAVQVYTVKLPIDIGGNVGVQAGVVVLTRLA
jgi:hypothetical protein